MTDTPQRYPLAWPAGRPRTEGRSRKLGQFNTKDTSRGYTRTIPITISKAMDRLEDELDRLGGRYAILSSDLELRLDGRPRSGQRAPEDPGVCLYFQMGGKPYAMACDTFTEVEQNIAAIAAHIEATRAITRYGVATAAETLQAFAALPPPPVISLPATRPWRVVLGLENVDLTSMPASAAKAACEAAYRDKLKAAHGNDDATREVVVARDGMRAEFP